MDLNSRLKAASALHEIKDKINSLELRLMKVEKRLNTAGKFFIVNPSLHPHSNNR